MSDRRPSKRELWIVDEFEGEETVETVSREATPEDVLAAVREGVESGTIKGTVVSPHIAEGDGPYTPNLHLDPGTYLVIPVDVGSLTVDCPTCDGLGVDITKWESANERHAPCPDCHGSGLVSDGGSET